MKTVDVFGIPNADFEALNSNCFRHRLRIHDLIETRKPNMLCPKNTAS